MRKIVSLILVLILLLSMAGCGAGRKPQYGLILSNDYGYQQKIAESYRQTVESLGGQVVTLTAGTLDEQVAAIETLIKKGVVGISLCPVEYTGLEDALNSARAAGIYSVALDADTKEVDYYINHASPEMASRAFLDEVYELTGGDGEFALISYGIFSGMNVFVNAIEHLIREEKYQDLIWVNTLYCDEEADLPDALLEIEDCDVICCTQGNLMPLLAEELKDTGVKLTGFGVPSAMKDVMGPDGPCDAYYFWDYTAAGKCAAELICALGEGKIQDGSESFTAKDGTVYPIYAGLVSERMVYSGAPVRIDKDAAPQWEDIA